MAKYDSNAINARPAASAELAVGTVRPAGMKIQRAVELCGVDKISFASLLSVLGVQLYRTTGPMEQPQLEGNTIPERSLVVLTAELFDMVVKNLASPWDSTRLQGAGLRMAYEAYEIHYTNLESSSIRDFVRELCSQPREVLSFVETVTITESWFQSYSYTFYQLLTKMPNLKAVRFKKGVMYGSGWRKGRNYSRTHYQHCVSFAQDVIRDAAVFIDKLPPQLLTTQPLSAAGNIFPIHVEDLDVSTEQHRRVDQAQSTALYFMLRQETNTTLQRYRHREVRNKAADRKQTSMIESVRKIDGMAMKEAKEKHFNKWNKYSNTPYDIKYEPPWVPVIHNYLIQLVKGARLEDKDTISNLIRQYFRVIYMTVDQEERARVDLCFDVFSVKKIEIEEVFFLLSEGMDWTEDELSIVLNYLAPMLDLAIVGAQYGYSLRQAYVAFIFDEGLASHADVPILREPCRQAVAVTVMKGSSIIPVWQGYTATTYHLKLAQHHRILLQKARHAQGLLRTTTLYTDNLKRYRRGRPAHPEMNKEGGSVVGEIDVAPTDEYSYDFKSVHKLAKLGNFTDEHGQFYFGRDPLLNLIPSDVDGQVDISFEEDSKGELEDELRGLDEDRLMTNA
ncbi:hypothetical protein EJ08DRAFT_661976 [Tothia fuscella]|uniref:Uncharacterized protein n=1 Tax=Tothia fuscella TaxID=1048955 RepID=A0A9P4TXV4_9PEZI|nr:hypothetical protein EJ08DRAFT_661976 [Tothia fuscella]